jgi:hypothetical protein
MQLIMQTESFLPQVPDIVLIQYTGKSAFLLNSAFLLSRGELEREIKFVSCQQH